MEKEIGMSGFMAVWGDIVIPKEETTQGWGEESCCQAWEGSWPPPNPGLRKPVG